jgi:putative ABC transport system substrate-binding protein
VNRRDLLALLAGVATVPTVAFAQQAPVIGFLSGRGEGESRYLVASFRDGLREAGVVGGQNLVIEFRWADGGYDRLPAQAADLVQRRVAVIVAVGAVSAIRAARAATSSIPIVFVTGDDPVRLKLVASLSRPEGNVTGITPFTQQIEPKRLSILDDLLPKPAKIAVLLNPNSPGTGVRSNEIEAAARTLGRQLDLLSAGSAGEIDAAFAVLAPHGNGGLMIGGDPFFNAQRDQLVSLAARHKIPTLYFAREFIEAGGLISYGASIAASYRQAGIYAGRILKGAQPADLPVQQPTKFELLINLKTAKALDLAIPALLLAQADEVIE